MVRAPGNVLQGRGRGICAGSINGGQLLRLFCSGIPFSAMRSGEWRILLAGDEVQVQRTITLTVGEPEVETVTVCMPRASLPAAEVPSFTNTISYRPLPPSC